MRVVILSPRFLPSLGGMETQVFLLARELKTRGHEPLVIAEILDGSNRGVPAGEVDGIKVVHVGRQARCTSTSPDTRPLRTQISAGLGYLGALLRYARGADLIMVRSFTTPAIAAALLCRVGAISAPTIIVAETGGVASDTSSFFKGPLGVLKAALMRRRLLFNAMTIEDRDALLARDIPESSIMNIPNGIDLATWSQAQPRLSSSSFVYFGRLEESKGILDLVAAFIRLRHVRHDAKLTLIGDGHLRHHLEQVVADPQLCGSLTLKGPLWGKKLASEVAKHDCFVLPSYGESFGLAAYEAAALGLQLVLSDVARFREFFGESAWIVRPGASDELLTGMMEALNQPRPPVPHETLSHLSVQHTTDRFLELARRSD